MRLRKWLVVHSGLLDIEISISLAVCKCKKPRSCRRVFTLIVSSRPLAGFRNKFKDTSRLRLFDVWPLREVRRNVRVTETIKIKK